MINKSQFVKNLWIVWSAIFGAVLFFAGLNEFAGDSLKSQIGQIFSNLYGVTSSREGQAPIVLVVFIVLASALLVMGILFRKVIFSPKKSFANGVFDQAGAQKYFRGQILSCAFFEATAIFGLILGAIGHDSAAKIFFILAILALLFTMPSTEGIP